MSEMPEMPESPAEKPSTPPAATPPGMTPADCAAQLKQRFPALFGPGYKPLKLRIQADIQERAPGAFTKQALSAFLRRYTGSTGYLIALTKSPHRFDLDGNPSGELSEEHRKAAAEELARRRANHQAKLELAEEQRRNRATLLRDFQNTTLTPANFSALKGLALEELEPLLEIARQEAQERQERPRPAPGAFDGRRPRRQDGGGGRRPRG